MKRNKVLVIVLCAVLALAIFAGCGKAKDALSAAEKALNEMVQGVEKEAKTIEEKLEVTGKAALEVLHEDEKKLVYKFKIAEEDIVIDAKEAEEKVNACATDFEAKLQELKDKGIKDAEVVVQFLDKEGKEIYSKVFK